MTNSPVQRQLAQSPFPRDLSGEGVSRETGGVRQIDVIATTAQRTG